MKKGLIALLCILLCIPCALGQQAPELLEPAGVQLNAVAAFVGDISRITLNEGAVVPYVEGFFFEQEGVIDTVHVIPGQMVQAGEAMITLDTDSEKERIGYLRRQIEQLNTNGAYEDELAQIDMAILETELKQLLTQIPVDENAVMLKKLDIEEKKLDIQLTVDLRTMELEQLTAELENLEADVAANVLYAPFTGRVAFMTAHWLPGSYVGAFTPILYLADDTRLYVESDYISNSTLDRAHDVYAYIGDKRYKLIPEEVDERDYLTKVLSGEKLTRKFEIAEPEDSLEAGQYAPVCVESDYRQDVLLVPTGTLYSADRTRYVYVIENGVRVRRNVETGMYTDWYTQITAGLEEGELVYVPE